MKPDFDVGDLVVCVDDSIIECPNGRHIGNKSIRRGSVFRVEKFATTKCGCGEIRTAVGAGHIARFRKIDRADDSFIEMLAACKPKEITV